MVKNSCQSPGYEGYYASKSGKIYSSKQSKIRQQACNGKAGYMYISIKKDDKITSLLTHRAVGLAWLELPEGLSIEDVLNNPRVYQINHIVEDKTKNTLDNLEFVTASENINYGSRNARVAQKMANNQNAAGHSFNYDAPRSCTFVYECDGKTFPKISLLADYLVCSKSAITEAFRRGKSKIKGKQVTRKEKI